RADGESGRESSHSWEVARHSNGQIVLSPNRVRVNRPNGGGSVAQSAQDPLTRKLAPSALPGRHDGTLSSSSTTENFMQTRRLGRTDLSVAPLVLGGNVFGWTADKKTSLEVLGRSGGAW